jgi:hypothetical protein
MAGVHCRGYSLPLQRRMTDFGADVTFAEVTKKLQEHYGITIPVSAARTITEQHAQAMQAQEQVTAMLPKRTGVATVIAEVDGSMVPIVDTAKEGEDRRKTRTVRWQEARLSLAHAQGSVSPVVAATLGSVEEAGDQRRHCAIQAGRGQRSHVHCVGDGAPWMAEQVQRVFAGQATYRLDFYHLSDYLAAAAPTCAPAEPLVWLETQQQALRTGHVDAVIATLQAHREPDAVADRNAPVRACYRYLSNRLDQVDYPRALAAQLPIGSGEIESAHRYVIQKRLKLPGAWCKEDNAQPMLVLRTRRANRQWDSYWEGLAQQAA